MQVGDERREVGCRDARADPALGAVHGIENAGSEPLVYVSAATPAFDLAAAYDSGSPWQRPRA